MIRTESISGYSFEGPYSLENTEFNNVAGIYFISDDKGNYMDVGETDSLKDRLASHERRSCWKRNAVGVINIWFHAEASYQTRLLKEKSIRNTYKFFCGKQ